MINTVYIKINNEILDIDSDSTDIFKMNKYIVRTDNNFSVGGEYSSTFTIPSTNRNLNILQLSKNHQAIKFKKGLNFEMTLESANMQLFSGKLIVKSLTNSRIEVEILSESSGWISKLNKLKLRDLDWKGSTKSGIIYRGAESFNAINSLDNTQTDFVLPTVLRVKQPSLDYLYSYKDLNGYTDELGDYISPKISLPDDYPVDKDPVPNSIISKNYPVLSDTTGFTHKDFPPAVYYSNLLDKIFSTVGTSFENTLKGYDWFNKLIMTFSGDEYEYNYATINELKLRGYNIASTERLLESPSPTVSDQPYLYRYSPYMLLAIDFTSTLYYIYTNDIPSYGLSSQLHKYIAYNINDATPNNRGTSVMIPMTVSKYTDIIRDSTANFDSNRKLSLPDLTTGVPNQKLADADLDIRGSDSPYWRVPADGKYKFKVKLRCSEYDPNNPNDPNNTFGLPMNRAFDPSIEYRFYSQAFVIYKLRDSGTLSHPNIYLGEYDTSGDLYTILKDLASYPNGNADYQNNTDFLLVARPLMNTEFGIPVSDYKVFYCPINQSQPTVNSFSASHIYTSLNFYKQNNFVDLEFEVELLRDEKIYFGRYVRLGAIGNYQAIACNTSLEIELEITPLCGDIDLDLARNLPDISANELISDFVKRFNMNYIFENNTIKFVNLKTDTVGNAINLDKYIDWDSRKYSSLDVASNINLGYVNDIDDYNLFGSRVDCSNENTNYFGVKQILNDDFEYSLSSIGSQFSATIFNRYLVRGSDTSVIKSDHYYTSLLALEPTLYRRDMKLPATQISTVFSLGVNFYSPENYIFHAVMTTRDLSIPITTDPITTDNRYFNRIINFGSLSTQIIDFPVLFNYSTAKATKQSELEYSWSQKMRLLQFHGLASTDFSNEIVLENPNSFQRLSYQPESNPSIYGAGYYITPTLTSFDLENGATQSLRYDVEGGLYDLLFGDNYIQSNNSSNYKEVLEVEAALPFIIYKQLNAASTIEINNILYKLLEIRDYDLTNTSLCKLKLLKL